MSHGEDWGYISGGMTGKARALCCVSGASDRVPYVQEGHVQTVARGTPTRRYNWGTQPSVGRSRRANSERRPNLVCFALGITSSAGRLL